jgi:hypothetical protein
VKLLKNKAWHKRSHQSGSPNLIERRNVSKEESADMLAELIGWLEVGTVGNDDDLGQLVNLNFHHKFNG